MIPYSRTPMWPVVLSFFAAVLGMLFANALLAGAVLAFYYRRDPDTAIAAVQTWATSLVGLGSSAVATGLVLTLVAYVGGVVSSDGVTTRLALGKSHLGAARIAASAVATFAAGLVFGELADMLGFADSGVLAVVAKSVNDASFSAWLLSLIGLAVVPGIAEELFFRGFVQTRAIAAMGPVRGIVISSVMFGLFHMDVKQGLYAMMVGGFLGWLAHRARSIRPSMLAHGTSNFLGLCMSRAGIGPASTTSKVVLAVFAASVVTVAIVAVARRSSSDEANAPTSKEPV